MTSQARRDMHNYSDYIIYVDESGDHSLTSIDEAYPIFVLSFCIFNKQSYSESLVQKLKHFKFKYFGHDMVILHENEIRKDKGDFRSLKPKEKRDVFMGELTTIIEEEEFTVIATIIKKDELVGRYMKADNPYSLALRFCMERTYKYLASKNQEDKTTHIVVEKRGQKEDRELELEFRRICDGSNYENIHFPFEIIMAHKQSNSAGLQLADLIARPIGIKHLRPTQSNRSYDVIETKFYKNGSGRKEGYGLKKFP